MLTGALTGSPSSMAIIGHSSVTVRLRAEIGRVAPFASNVLITGPSGTGKELVARQIHLGSPRARQPFIPVDCAAISGELMSSQLFGHVAGAFTGANCDALGCFRAANRGTIFLDEIGELEYALQAKLLRVLQEHVVTPVGSHRGEPVDVRVIAATNRDVRAEVLAGRFREDLYYRLDVVHLRTSALRDRRDDVPVLAAAFLNELADEGLPRCRLSSEARAILLDFDWPGNVRQLRNVLEQAAIDSQSPSISAAQLREIISLSFDSRNADSASHSADSPTGHHAVADCPQSMLTAAGPTVGEDSAWPTLESVERQHILRTLEHTFYNRSAAARLLGLTRQSLLRKMKNYRLNAPPKR
ncbi:MAG: sigma-54 dependent transcriptional regulator [Pirellulales bacterium]